MADVYPFNLPRQQLPQPTDRLSDGFLRALPLPVGLWTPSKLAKAAADFTPLSQKHFGALNGGITTTPSGWGTLGTAWKFNGTSGYISTSALQNAGSNIGNGFTIAMVVKASTSGTFSQICGILNTGNATAVAVDFNRNAALSAASGYTNFYIRDDSALALNGAFSNAIYNIYDGNYHSLILVAVSPSTNVLAMYVDGQAVSFTYGSKNNPSTFSNFGFPFYIGAVNARGAPANYSNATVPFLTYIESALTAAQVSSLYQALLTGEPYPLFQPQTVPMMMGSAAAPGSVSAAGGLIASGSLIASSILSVVGGIVSTFNLVASSLYDAAAGIQAAAAEAVASNLTSGSAGISALAVEQVLSNFAVASSSMSAAAAQQVLTNLIAASGGIAGSQSLIASSIISVLTKIQAIAEQSTAIAAQGLAGLSATGDVQVLNNLIALNEQLSAAASFVASSIYSAAARVDGPGSVAVLINLLSVAERVQALAQQLASSVNAMQAGSGASATVIASSLYRASAGCGAFATVSAILDAAICELASIRPSYTAEAILRAMYQSAAGVRPSYAARADIDGC